MKVNVKAGNKKYAIEFSVHPGPRTGPHLVVMAKSSKDLDMVQDYIESQGGGDKIMGVIVAQAVEKQLKLPVEKDYGYPGAGIGLNFDLYSVAKSLK
jgi:hypothetical protein